jgi:hypothetical protein
MKMLSQKWLYLGIRLGMMMKSRSDKKRRFVHNAQNIGLVDTVFEELVSDKSFIETCNFLRSHAIRLDQQYKEKGKDRFTILTNYPIDPRRRKSKRS